MLILSRYPYVSIGECLVRRWCLAALAAIAGPVWACSNIQLMVLNWSSAQLLAALDYHVLTQGFECQVEVVTGTTRSAAVRLDESESVWVPEFWIDSGQTEPSDAWRVANDSPFDSAGAGFYVSAEWLAANPSVSRLEQALVALSDLENPMPLYGCAAGWSCQTPIRQWSRALNIQANGWYLVEPAGRADWGKQLEKAMGSDRPWVGWAIGPASELSKYDLVRLRSGREHDPEHYQACYQNPSCPDPKIMAPPPSRVVSAGQREWLERHPLKAQYFAKRRLSAASLKQMFADLERGLSFEEVVVEYLATRDEWHAWLDEGPRQAILDQFN